MDESSQNSDRTTLISRKHCVGILLRSIPPSRRQLTLKVTCRMCPRSNKAGQTVIPHTWIPSRVGDDNFFHDCTLFVFQSFILPSDSLTHEYLGDGSLSPPNLKRLIGNHFKSVRQSVKSLGIFATKTATTPNKTTHDDRRIRGAADIVCARVVCRCFCTTTRESDLRRLLW